MKIAFPMAEDKGLDSLINDQFGGAKNFMIVDLDTRKTTVAANQKHLEGKFLVGYFSI